MEIVSHAALAFVSAIRETAYVIDPSLEIRIELISGTESSLSLNSLIKSLKPKDLLSKRNLLTLAVVALFWFRHELTVWGFQDILNFLTAEPTVAHLSEEDKQAIAERVADILDKRLGAKQVESVYRALQADTSVLGVGASTQAGKRPASIVPRAEFHARIGAPTTEHTDAQTRSKTETETVTLIRPVLLPSQYHRRWGFRGKEGEFGAEIKDSAFIDNLIEGRTAVPLVSGIQLIVELQTASELKDNVWQITDRTVLKVFKIIPPGIQQNLGSSPRDSTPRPGASRKRKDK